jgi:hypothetical protein
MGIRAIAILALALLAGGCSSLTDRAIAMVGGPERGFLTPAILSDDGSAPVETVSMNGCTTVGCPQAAGFCLARRYQPGTISYNRCILSVEQNLRRQASLVTRTR